MNISEIQKDREFHKDSKNSKFHPGPPFERTKAIAKIYECDIAVPNGEGIGNVVCFTRVVEELSRKSGKPLRMLTAPIKPLVGTVETESDYPVWDNNPFVDSIVNSDDIDPSIIKVINSDQDNCFQYCHFIQNICLAYKVRASNIKPSVFLSEQEQKWAINTLQHIKRPLLVIHPSGTSSPIVGASWYKKKWRQLVRDISDYVGVFQVGKADLDLKDIGGQSFPTSLRQLMAIIWASDIFIGFDSGPAHIAAAFNKPSAIVWDILRKNPIEEHLQEGFGASAMTRWSYKENFNLMLLGEKDDEALYLLKKFIMTEVFKFTY